MRKISLLALAMTLAHAEIPTTTHDQSHLSLTIYNDNLALIRDARKVALEVGENRVAWQNVSASIQAESALLSSQSAPVTLLEQNFDYDLLDENALLNKYVGKEITVITQNPTTGEEKRESALLLANNNGVILKYPDRIESALPANARLAFAEVPTHLRERPTLTIDLHSETNQTHDLNLSYLSTGFGWKADYVATLAPDEKSLDLAGWVTVNNNSGIEYENAQLQLVAGDVHRAPAPQMPVAEMMMRAAAIAPAPQSALEEEALFDYHLYTLPRPTTLKNNQQKQLALLSAAQIPAQKTYRVSGNYNGHYRYEPSENGEEREVEVLVSFENKEPLGKALPAGVVRVYKQDSQQNMQLIGEDRIKHTPKNETLRLKMGNAFDIKAHWKLLEQKRLNNTILGYEQRLVKVAIELRNQKDEEVTIEVLEPMGTEWKIESENYPHEKVSARDAMWNIKVPANEKVTLEYSAKLKY